ncbi:chorion class A protein Ld12-like [Pieris brassicae]|uniref:Uncharacterized protein n=1 Tax=Pieris brassicae TaxID=7116 RepID=A0A9P0XDW5_PIEBR|nr:chorion class A protein Ld12-like [Pieris brassicae]CAH4032633.1 unnamed protein product [Pieris brassicae]
MSTFNIVFLCLQACLVQTAFGWIAESPCAAGNPNPAWGLAGPAAIGLAPGMAQGPFGPASFAPAPYASAPLASAPFAPGAYEGIGAYGGEGIGDVAVAGEMPVAGTTMVAGQVPILGAVRFAGDLPAGGVVSIAGSCGCGRSQYMY